MSDELRNLIAQIITDQRVVSTDARVKLIDQAYRDADYYPLMSDEMSAVADYNDGRLLRPRQFYERFVKELGHAFMSSELLSAERKSVLAAAKRAAGLE